jgi:hypothetical protein
MGYRRWLARWQWSCNHVLTFATSSGVKPVNHTFVPRAHRSRRLAICPCVWKSTVVMRSGARVGAEAGLDSIQHGMQIVNETAVIMARTTSPLFRR